jgi:hypothetical protein
MLSTLIPARRDSREDVCRCLSEGWGRTERCWASSRFGTGRTVSSDMVFAASPNAFSGKRKVLDEAVVNVGAHVASSVPSRAPFRGPLCPTRLPDAPPDFVYRNVDLMMT